jgi:hypothetical protein
MQTSNVQPRQSNDDWKGQSRDHIRIHAGIDKLEGVQHIADQAQGILGDHHRHAFDRLVEEKLQAGTLIHGPEQVAMLLLLS